MKGAAQLRYETTGAGHKRVIPLLENKDCCPALIEGKSFEVMNLGGLAHLSFQRTEAAPSFAVFEGWAAEARRRTLPGLLPSTARGVAHSLKLPRVRRKHNTENCSMPTAPARAPVRALPDCDACSATCPHACLRSTPQNHRTAAATCGLRSMRPPTAGSGRTHCACANLAEPSARSAVLTPASR